MRVHAPAHHGGMIGNTAGEVKIVFVNIHLLIRAKGMSEQHASERSSMVLAENVHTRTRGVRTHERPRPTLGP